MPPSSINISALSIRPHLKITQIKGAAVITVALANGGRADQRACRFHPSMPSNGDSSAAERSRLGARAEAALTLG